MATRQFEITNKLGLHARPASLFVKTASQFDSSVSVEVNGRTTNGKSVLGLLTIAAEKGTVLTVSAEGADATEALDALEQLFRDGFGED
jgi:phosphocarrier protein